MHACEPRLCPTYGRKFSAVLLLGVIAIAGCDRPDTRQGPQSGEHSHTQGSAVADALREKLTAGSDVKLADASVNAEALRAVYESRNYAPIWTGSGRAEADAKAALAALGDSESDGLNPDDYRFEQLSAFQANDDSARAERDLLLTDSLLRYARDLRAGRVRPSDIDQDIALPEITFDFSGALANAAANGTLSTFLAELAPKHPEYQRLKQALARYRAIEAAGGWPTLPAQGKREIDIAAPDLLRARLAAEDVTVTPTEDPVEALKDYQERSGFNPDGRLGPRTLAMLNIPVAARIDQIKANMERWRWMPEELEPRRIVVNVADATLQVIDGGRAVLESKVVVGEPEWRTPILRTEAKAVTVNPVWHVPQSIATKEIWPKAQSDPSYLEAQGLVVVEGQIRQPPGPKNALGRIKIEMPNDFRVYLHDTPAKAAFSRDARMISHGCVRVEQIMPLASVVLSGDPQSEMGRLSELIATNETKRLDLDRPIPVYLLYWTAIADENGRVAFRDDSYERDKLVITALGGEDMTPRTMSELDV